jgi:hypothetical protein
MCILHTARRTACGMSRGSNPGVPTLNNWWHRTRAHQGSFSQLDSHHALSATFSGKLCDTGQPWSGHCVMLDSANFILLCVTRGLGQHLALGILLDWQPKSKQRDIGAEWINRYWLPKGGRRGEGYRSWEWKREIAPSFC